MERQVRQLALALGVLFVVLVAQVTYIQVVSAERLAENPANAKRQLIAEYEVNRGKILAADGRTVLALSKRSPGELRFERRYPQGALNGFVTGYYSFVYGRSRLEQSFNEYLAGEAPQLLPQTLTDMVLGRPRRGASIITSIEPELQEAATRALGDLPGGVAAVDPRTGNVLALVANPSYDPNPLSSHDPAEVRRTWEGLNADPDKPLRSRASDELYPPGSTFKIVVAAAALANGYGPTSTWPNPHELDLPDTSETLSNFGGVTCSGGSRITLADALRQSCNVVFGGIGLELGAEALAEQAWAFGFAPTGTAGDVPFDVPFQEGVFPDPSYFQDRRPAVALSAIGQDNVAANPLQMALVAGAIGNGGELMRPRLVTEVRAPDGQVVETFEPDIHSRPMTQVNASLLTAMMVEVVESGTGTAARIPGVSVAGKTGTAQHGEGEDPHAWFVSFAPAEDPEIAVAVIVLDGGSLGSEATGGALAAPIARAVMEAALNP
ncbi:MAG TPA: penicillin-binding transpeptidase domain-containing protein [Actinomycetota bacterium]|nr:penicillin-binding transpeptidase domain-containing protein [Actinomycetota bacterium]